MQCFISFSDMISSSDNSTTLIFSIFSILFPNWLNYYYSLLFIYKSSFYLFYTINFFSKISDPIMLNSADVESLSEDLFVGNDSNND